MDNPPHDTLRQLAELYQQGRMRDLLDASRPLLLRFPNSPPLLTLVGVASLSTGQFSQAHTAFSRLVQLRPADAEAHNNLGIARRRLGQLPDAAASFRKAIALKPDYAEAHNNLGNALRDEGAFAAAIDAYQQALRLRPAYADALANLAAALVSLRRRDEAIACYERVLALHPNHASARAEKLHQMAHICDWDGIAADAPLIPQLGVTGEPVSPFAMLALEDAPERHRIRSERLTQKKYLRPEMPPRARPPARPERLRIGYFSGDFFEHATMHLMAKLFEAHDRQRYLLHAFSYGPNTHDAMRTRAEAAFDSFHDVRSQSDEAIAALVREQQIDIAVDLKGHTTDGRLGVLGHRPAPVQMSYIGYPGAIGAPFIDYIIADRIVIPEAQRSAYSESVVFLPDCYQVNDNTRPIAERQLTRAEAGLPQSAFVFCCFNNSFKITPAEFDIWMRLLQRVEGSVLWLLEANPWAVDNLRTQAKRRGVDPGRLHFAPRAPQAEHLTRHRLADLFLDTFNYNAHTTAADALWAGLPIVTKAGDGFAARVGASLLSAIGLPELIAASAAAYEDLALALAADAPKLAAIKSRLAANRLSSPLFDTERFARRLENAFEQAYARYLRGEPPGDIEVAP